MSSDLDVLKDIPGYKAILKSVLKSQIQLLIEQLSEQTGEESIILTASINDGTLSHLGSNTGKGFLEGRDEVKSQFLGYCLKSYHKQQKNQQPSQPFETSSSPNSHPVMPPYTHRPARPTPYDRLSGGKQNTEYYASKPFKNVHRYPALIKPLHETAQTSMTESSESTGVVKQEPGSESGYSNVSDTSSHANDLQDTSSSLISGHKGNELSQGNFMAASTQRLEPVQASDTQVKIEAISQEELDLEITGVEPGSFQSSQWESPDHSTMYSQEQQNTGEAPPLLTTSLEDSVADFKDKLLSCKYCGKNFLHASWLVRHERKHTGERPHQCHICHKAFTRKFHLQSHITTVHKDNYLRNCSENNSDTQY